MNYISNLITYIYTKISLIKTIFYGRNRKYVKIYYINNLALHSIYIPYCRKNSLSHLSSSIQVFLHKNNDVLDITPQPGLPFLCSPNCLDADKISVVSNDTITYYYGDEIPSLSSKPSSTNSSNISP